MKNTPPPHTYTQHNCPTKKTMATLTKSCGEIAYVMKCKAKVAAGEDFHTENRQAEIYDYISLAGLLQAPLVRESSLCV